MGLLSGKGAARNPLTGPRNAYRKPASKSTKIGWPVVISRAGVKALGDRLRHPPQVQNGFTTARITMAIMITVGTSFIAR